MKRSTSQLSPSRSPDSHKHKRSKSNTPVIGGPVQSPNSNDADGWTKVEKRKQKKAKNQQVKHDKSQPRFLYSNSEIIQRKNAISIDEIRELILHITADAPPPNWLRVDNCPLIQKTIALQIPGITPELISLPPLPTSATVNPNIPIAIPLPPKTELEPSASPSLPFISTTFSHACPTRAPGDATRMHSVFSNFFNGPVSHQEKQKRMTMRALAYGTESSRNRDPGQYLLPVEQMVENDYPIPSYVADVFQKPEGWLETPDAPKPSLLSQSPNAPRRKIYAIDCEMCMTEDGKDLARVCMIDYYSGKVVYDQLVKPPKPILDYLTRWSGITAEALAPVTTTLPQVQSQILKLLSPPAPNPFSSNSSSSTSTPFETPILIGHSLESDLKALKLCHPACIDTALLYHHPRGRPLKPGLAWLTKKWCNREIQMRGDGGHDPEEDARACIDLLKKKLEEGPEFGEFKIDYESIFERMGKSVKRGAVRSAVVDHGNPTAMHGAKATTSIACTSDEEIVQNLMDVIPSHDFVFGRFMELSNALGWSTPRATSDLPAPEPAPPPSPEELANIVAQLNLRLQTVHATLPSRTAIIIFTGHSDPRRMSELNARKIKFETALRSGKTPSDLGDDEKWTMSDARELEEAVALARRGLLFLGVK